MKSTPTLTWNRTSKTRNPMTANQQVIEVTVGCFFAVSGTVAAIAAATNTTSALRPKNCPGMLPNRKRYMVADAERATVRYERMRYEYGRAGLPALSSTCQCI